MPCTVLNVVRRASCLHQVFGRGIPLCCVAFFQRFDATCADNAVALRWREGGVLPCGGRSWPKHHPVTSLPLSGAHTVVEARTERAFNASCTNEAPTIVHCLLRSDGGLAFGPTSAGVVGGEDQARHARIHCSPWSCVACASLAKHLQTKRPTNGRLTRLAVVEPAFGRQGPLTNHGAGGQVQSGKARICMVVGADVHRDPRRASVAKKNIAANDLTRARSKFCRGRVAEHHGSSWVKRFVVFVESPSNPEHVVLRLLVQRFPRVISGMNEPEAVQHEFGWKVIEPQQIVEEGCTSEVQFSFGANHVGAPGSGPPTLHPWLPQGETTLRAQRHRRHALMVSKQEQQSRVFSHQVEHACGVWPAVDGITEEHHAVLVSNLQPMQQRAKRTEVPMNVPNCIDAMAMVEPGLEVCFEGVVPVRGRRREHLLARQGESPRRCLAPRHPSS